MKLALGTVQFGLSYGAFNADGQVSVETAKDILEAAAHAGIGTLDTAHSYGASEAVLGLLGAPARFSIVTKVAALASAGDEAAQVRASIGGSLSRLGVASVRGLLLHSAGDLLGPGGAAVWAAMAASRDRGEAERIGVSVYSPAQVDDILARFPIEIVQLPINVFDQRMHNEGTLDRLQQAGVEVHARSAYLQGFALASPDALPPHLRDHAPALLRFDAIARELGLSRAQAALGFATAMPGIDKVVVGVQNSVQLREAIGALQFAVDPAAFAACRCHDEALINPSRWLAGAGVSDRPNAGDKG